MASAWDIADSYADSDVKIHADIRGCGAPIHLYSLYSNFGTF